MRSFHKNETATCIILRRKREKKRKYYLVCLVSSFLKQLIHSLNNFYSIFLPLSFFLCRLLSCLAFLLLWLWWNSHCGFCLLSTTTTTYTTDFCNNNHCISNHRHHDHHHFLHGGSTITQSVCLSHSTSVWVALHLPTTRLQMKYGCLPFLGKRGNWLWEFKIRVYKFMLDWIHQLMYILNDSTFLPVYSLIWFHFICCRNKVCGLLEINSVLFGFVGGR